MPSTIDWDAYTKRIIQAAIAGLDNAAPALRTAAEAKARSNFRGQTHATFNGIYAVVDGEGVDSTGLTEAAIEAVRDRNPAHVYTEPAPAVPAGTVRLLLSVPTDYINKLEADPIRAFLARTLDEENTAIKQAVDAAVGGAA